MFNKIFNYLLNNYKDLSSLVTVILAGATLFIAYKELILKRRPFIDIEIQKAENSDKEKKGWLFFALLKNKGTYPGIVRVSKTIMKIGDEEYLSEIKNEFVLSPGEEKKSALIGSIYESGIKRVLGHEYMSNRVELVVEIDSRGISEKKMKYKSKFNYEVNVKNKEPLIVLISEAIK